jgi:hypothetical protein
LELKLLVKHNVLVKKIEAAAAKECKSEYKLQPHQLSIILREKECHCNYRGDIELYGSTGPINNIRVQ